ncbi:glucans biosynthesis protein [Verrucomicrobium sp. GAS474]|uniref:glucan biosynthesis protein n=1 Tax=Verrucomicrobium sp. GAS474 TaxID=1882831 RepID=UPI00087BCCE8|nr:glucan biosynthesis protein G [Verrucomicrobium sp. GAS474]SDU11943.1 glucans biosynthesis protein [Verrucomicrobium sp. GAS474]
MKLHLTLAALTALLLFVSLRYSPGHAFSFAQVERLAAKQAEEKFVPLRDALPPQLRNLTPQQENGIFWKDSYRLWRDKGLPFQVDFYHLSRQFPSGPRINTVDRHGAHPLAYSPAFFNFLNLDLRPPLPANLPFAGFYLRYPINKADSLDGFFSVLGSSYFRALAKEQVYGLTARGLAIDTALDGKAEEYPSFTEWWLRRPASNATDQTLYALLDSPSVSGAYEFRIRPGASTSVDVHAVLYFRKAVERIGLAPFSSMYLYGENSGDHFGDTIHPEVHDSDGVLVHSGNGDWIWRPLQATPFLQQYDFAETDPKGFGLLQRDRDFQHYQDLDTKYNVRPSAWVTPHGNWGKGSIALVQLPTNNTDTDNVVLSWRPERVPAKGDRLEFNYTVDFYMNDAERPSLAYAMATHFNSPAPPPPNAAPPRTPESPKPATLPSPSNGTVPVQFLVDFKGNGIEDIPPDSPPSIDCDASPSGTLITNGKVDKNGYDGSWRISFTVTPLRHNVPTELRCRLLRDGKPLTETWTYTWHQ